MKKRILAAAVLLMIPAMACAQQVSITELHEQAEAMGRWTKTYDTPGGVLEVDVPVLVPDADACPVLTVENARPLSEELFAWVSSGRQTGDRNSPQFEVEIDGAAWEFALGTNGAGMTDDYEKIKEVWIQRGGYMFSQGGGFMGHATPATGHYPWTLDLNQAYARGTDMTIQEAMDIWQAQIALCYPGEEYVIAPKRIVVYGSTLAQKEDTGKYAQQPGYYQIVAEQLIGGFPVFGAIGSMDGENHYHIEYTSSLETNRIFDRLSPYFTGSAWACNTYLRMIGTDSENHRTMTALNRVRTVEYADVPLAPLDAVIAEIEKEIEAGRIRQVFSLRLGYLLYSNPEMTDYAWAVPRWVLDCSYITKENGDMIAAMHKHDTDGEMTGWTAPEFAQLPIDAQSGELIIFTTGDEATFSVPEIAVWEDAP